MRIVGGEAGGRAIQAPAGSATRPTTDRVREAVFSILGGDLTGAVVLDVFSGSGAMALEALSRGAERAVLCDNSRQAAAAIRRNIASLGYGGKALFMERDWRRALASLGGSRFSVVFVDPPYKQTAQYTSVLAELSARALLKDGALVVLEHEAGTAWPDFPAGYKALKPHKYGATMITVLRYTDGT